MPMSFPWRDVEVLITRGTVRNQTGIVKRVWPDGSGSLAVLLYMPGNESSLEVDYHDVVERG